MARQMVDMGRWGERDRDFIRLHDLDGGPRIAGADVGFYAIWSRSRRRLLVTVTPTERDVRAQVALRPPQATQLHRFLGSTTPSDPLRPMLELRDSDDPNDERVLGCQWWTGGSRLVVSMSSCSLDRKIGQIDLRPDQVPKLERFLANTAPAGSD